MSDIIERLDHAAKGWNGMDEAEEMALLNDAAREIERLREALLQAGIDLTCGRDPLAVANQIGAAMAASCPVS